MESMCPYGKININNVFWCWGDILGLLRDQGGYSWNSGRLNSGPEMTSFPEPPHSRPQMLACPFVVSSNPQTPGRMALLFLFYRWGEIDTKMLNNCLQVSPVPRGPESSPSNPALHDSDNIPSSSSSHCLTWTSALSPFPPFCSSQYRQRRSGHIWNKPGKVPYNSLSPP